MMIAQKETVASAEIKIELATKKALKPRAYIMLLATAALLIWGTELSRTTFHPLRAIILPALAGGTLITLLLTRKRKYEDSDWWHAWRCLHFIFGASLGYFSFVAYNYYASNHLRQTIFYPIISREIQTGKHNRKYLTIVVRINDVERDIDFEYHLKDDFIAARAVALKMEKGALGYYIYTDKEFVP